MNRTFRSDNNAGICPEALQAISDAASRGHLVGYGDDAITARAIAAFQSLLGDSATVFFVATGTAANTLAVASLTEPWHRVLCHVHSHWNDDESTAPERITHCRTAPIHPASGDDSKLTPADVERAAAGGRGDVHQPAAGVLTISNPTEFGTVYTPEEVRALCEVAHRFGYRVHVDGARFANAVASLKRTTSDSVADLARALTIDAGVDAISFGGTKNGLALGEAVIFFPQGDGADHRRAIETFPYHRKGTGHLLSKHRFISAPFEATLTNDLWVTHADRANTMAQALSSGLADAGVSIRFATQTNGVFIELPEALHETLWERGHRYYPFGDADGRVHRLMCSFDTQSEDVAALVGDVKELLARL